MVVLNLECCLSERGRPWGAPGKPSFFRAPPRAVELLVLFGVDCVTLANNHALDYGVDALADTLDHLAAAGIATVGAGADLHQARRPATLAPAGCGPRSSGSPTDRPTSPPAPTARLRRRPRPPGVAFADLARQVPEWLLASVRAVDADATLATPTGAERDHRAGPPRPPRRRRAGRGGRDPGRRPLRARATRRRRPVLYDLGDFLDDYRVDPRLRNDLGLLFLVTLDAGGPLRLEALP